MAAKIVFFGLLAFVAVQGLTASTLRQRSIFDSIKDKLTDVKDDIKDAAGTVADKAKEIASAAGDEAKKLYEETKQKLQDTLASVKSVAAEAKANIEATVQGITAKANEVVANAKQSFSNLSQKVENEVSSLAEKAKTLGAGAVSCVNANKDEAQAVIQASTTKVQTCVSSVQNKAEPVVKDLIKAVDSATELATTVGSVIATCAPAGASFVTAAPCLAVKAISVYSDAASDVTSIVSLASQIADQTPGLVKEVEACAGEVKTATSNVDQLISKIDKCVDDYSATAA